MHRHCQRQRANVTIAFVADLTPFPYPDPIAGEIEEYLCQQVVDITGLRVDADISVKMGEKMLEFAVEQPGGNHSS